MFDLKKKAKVLGRTALEVTERGGQGLLIKCIIAGAAALFAAHSLLPAGMNGTAAKLLLTLAWLGAFVMPHILAGYPVYRRRLSRIRIPADRRDP